MSAFLKIDDCDICRRCLPWEWVPAVLVNGKSLAGTGVWRSQLVGRTCPACVAAAQEKQQNSRRADMLRADLIRLLGGERPYREFTFARYRVAAENELAYERSRHFNPATDNLYLWGSCGVGKTHLSFACARRCFEEMLSVEIVKVGQLSRRIRMREPEQEQAAIDRLIDAEVLVLDDLAKGTESSFVKQIFQEILDGRNDRDRSGLIIASQYSPDALAEKLADDAIPSRLAGMCSVIEVRGADGRLTMQTESQ